jgi:glycolate dehydrogenase FAD-binding subunit
MKGVLHHDPGDQSVSVEAGVALAELQDFLAADGQMLAIEAPARRELSLGEVVARGRESACALRHGSLREQILGLSVRLPDGRLCRSGGRVAKNVTGYDLSRLHCGGEERFGKLVEISFRLRPRPSAEATWVFGCGDLDEAWRRALELRNLPHRLSGLVIEHGRSCGRESDAWRVALRVDGHPETLQSLDHRMRETRGAMRMDETSAAAQWERVADFDFAWPCHRVHRCGPRELRARISDIRDYVDAEPKRTLHFDFALPGLRLGQSATDPEPDFPRWAQIAVDPGRQSLETRLRRVFDPDGLLATKGRGEID